MSTATLSPPAVPSASPPDAGPSRPQRWARPALALLLLGTAALYLWNLSANGFANDYYAAAVQAGTQSVKAWLFGSLDAGNAITVDKPPASLWIMTASARIFGFSSWSLLVPQALEGVAAVALLHAAVKRWAGPVAGLLAGAALALTPAAVLMFRFDNPDALLTLTLVASAYAVVRAIDAASARASTWWLVLCGALVGLGFLTKMGQALLVVPALGLVYLVAGPTRLRTRILQLLAALAAMVVSAGWFVALVELWPASARPYIGGSTTNSLLELALGYNGIGRLLGGSGNGGGGGGLGGGANSGFGGATGLGRLFTSEMGLEISWLLPAALIALVAGLWISRRSARTDRLRASMLLWGGWTLVTGLVFSFMSGTIHPYYTVALAPGIAALVAVGGVGLWRRGATIWLALMVAATGAWSFVLLASSAEPFAWVRWVIAPVAVLAVVGLLVGVRRLVRATVVAALVAGIAGTAAYGVATAAGTHTGSIPSVGTVSSGMGGGAGGGPGGGTGTPPGGGGQRPALPSGASAPTGGGGFGDGGSGGGFGGGASTSTELTALLKATDSTWSAAVGTSQSAASLELATGTSVMSLGGWSGSDSAVTLEQFQADVASGAIHYYIGGGQGGGPGGGSDSTAGQIATWVAANFTATTVGGQTVYDLTS